MYINTKAHISIAGWYLAWGKDIHGRNISGQGRTVQQAIINALIS